MEKWKLSGGLGLITDVLAGPVVLRHYGDRSHGGGEHRQAPTFVGRLQEMGLKEVRGPPPPQGDCGVPEAKKGEVTIVLGSTLGKRAREG